MKKTLAIAVVTALAGATGAANAGDFYQGMSFRGPAYVPAPTWAGFYVGANVGGASVDIANADVDYYQALNRDWTNNEKGVFGGGTVGYNLQTNVFVFGVEADFGAIGLTSGDWNNHLVANDRHYLWANGDTSFYADVTGRLGYSAGPALFYLKGGWAYLDSGLEFGGWNVNTNSSWSVQTKGLSGFTIGGGIEYAWSQCWSLKAEYLYFDFGTVHDSWYGYGNTYNFDHDLTIQTFKVGVNYHLNNTIYSPLK